MQKIDGTTLDIYGMIVVAFLMIDKANQVRFFEETFLVVNVSPKIVFGIPFLTLSGVDVDFLDRELRWRTYIIKKALSIIRHVKLVGKKEFAAAALDPEHETFIVQVASLNSTPLDIHPFCRPWISSLIAKETPIKVSDEYVDFADIFSPDLPFKLFKHTGINNNAIKLIDGQQPPYRPIYSLELIELETLRAYIGTNLANRFIKPSKSPAAAPNLFNWKQDGSL